MQLTITVGRVGDVAMIGLGAEVFNEIGRAIKDASPFTHTFVITHCNGAAGYLPTRPSYDEGGYEVQSSRFGPGAAEQVIQEAVEMLRELQEGIDGWSGNNVPKLLTVKETMLE